MFKSIALFTVLVSLAVAQGGLESSCTLTATKARGCGCNTPLFTATQFSDCSGCALTTTTRGPFCDIACESTHGISSTTTVTACATCTNTVTTFLPACQGCTVTKSAETTTLSTDCKGCARAEVTTHVGGVCHYACPGGIQTITAAGTATETACAASITPPPQ